MTKQQTKQYWNSASAPHKMCPIKSGPNQEGEMSNAYYVFRAMLVDFPLGEDNRPDIRTSSHLSLMAAADWLNRHKREAEGQGYLQCYSMQVPADLAYIEWVDRRELDLQLAEVKAKYSWPDAVIGA
jgi:hypothetical protein